MQATIKRGYIEIKPKPRRDIPDGLKVELESESPLHKRFATMDILKGITEYPLPPRKILSITIVE